MATSASSPALSIRVSSASLCCRATSIPRHLADTSRSFLSFTAPLSRSSLRLVVFARRRKSSSAPTKREEVPPRRKSTLQDSDRNDDDIDEDAFEALFAQLEEDLKNDNLFSDDADDDITEEDLARLEQELEEAFADEDNEEVSEVSLDSENLNRDEDDEEEEKLPKLKNWQIRRLARALKIGRRKTSIKNLAAELGLERAVVLELLRDPPPNLLLMSASLPDEITQTSGPSSTPLPTDIGQTIESGNEPSQSPLTISDDDVESKPERDLPVHVMQSRWLMQKRLKKVQVETLERVYSRTKRPTNAMISSIVHVTNLPWKRVLKWFEDKRLEDGIPDHRIAYRRSSPETVSSS
ncbi:hypothetical protein Cni_G17751 [Canna indica]|uniref:Homeobox domain-containing protein n=1 Tax=Canna indica TaxID=4628 RepID=A0AAQ3QH28_9LILI|nr:hypothetical protein Cni_G17751 [Canna indica]